MAGGCARCSPASLSRSHVLLSCAPATAANSFPSVANGRREPLGRRPAALLPGDAAKKLMTFCCLWGLSTKDESSARFDGTRWKSGRRQMAFLRFAGNTRSGTFLSLSLSAMLMEYGKKAHLNITHANQLIRCRQPVWFFFPATDFVTNRRLSDETTR